MSLIRILVCLTIILGLGNVALADMQILSATPSQTDRFSGSGSFAFSQFDFSGVGNTSNGTGVTGTTPGTDGTFDAAGIGTGQWGTLIAPGYFLTAAHDAPAVGSSLNFYANPSASNGFSAQIIVTDQVVSETQLTFVNTSGQTVASDLMLGKLATPATGVTFYSIAQDNQSALTNQEIITVGRPYRVGTNSITGFLQDVVVPSGNQGDSLFYTFSNTSTNPFENFLIGGDSGGPGFVIGPNGQLQIVGINWWNGTVNLGAGDVPASGDTYVPEYLAEINQLMGVPEPSSLILSAVGGLGLVAFLRRRRRA
jgi:hypothetical protein